MRARTTNTLPVSLSLSQTISRSNSLLLTPSLTKLLFRSLSPTLSSSLSPSPSLYSSLSLSQHTNSLFPTRFSLWQKRTLLSLSFFLSYSLSLFLSLSLSLFLSYSLSLFLSLLLSLSLTLSLFLSLLLSLSLTLSLFLSLSILAGKYFDQFFFRLGAQRRSWVKKKFLWSVAAFSPFRLFDFLHFRLLRANERFSTTSTTFDDVNTRRHIILHNIWQSEKEIKKKSIFCCKTKRRQNIGPI